MSRRSHVKRGFTLLELLVVVAVIALLLAILLPALSAASEAGRATVCGANLSQLAQGSIAYSEANDSFMPWFGAAQRRPEGGQWWVTQVARGMETFEPKVYRCPTDPVPYGVPVYMFNGQAYMNDVFPYRTSFDGGSYMSVADNDRPVRDDRGGGRTLMLQVSYRGACDTLVALHLDPGTGKKGWDPTYKRGSAGFGTWEWFVRRTTEFTDPGKVVLMAEGQNSFQYELNRDNQKECLSIGTESSRMLDTKTFKYQAWKRHFGTSNLSFVDGHVERLPPEDVAISFRDWKMNGLPPEKRRNIYPAGVR